MTLSIVRGKTISPLRRILVGAPGAGKSTFACAEPGALALDYEDGLHAIGVDRVVGATDWLGSLAMVKEACSGPGEHRAVVIDTIDRIEAQAARYICTTQGVEGKKLPTLSDYGYNRGFVALAQIWRELLFACEGARAKGRSVTLVAHCKREKVNDPVMGEYTEWIAAIHKDCWSATHQWADAVLFAAHDGGVVEKRAILSGERLLYTQAMTGFRAKHRPDIATKLPLQWSAYAAAVEASQRDSAEVLASIAKLSLISPETREKAGKLVSEANGNVSRLVAIEKALLAKVGA